MSAGCMRNERAICGKAVAMIVPSRFSMKNVAATSVMMSDELLDSAVDGIDEMFRLGSLPF